MKKLALLFSFSFLVFFTHANCDSAKVKLLYDASVCTGDSTNFTIVFSGGGGLYHYGYIYADTLLVLGTYDSTSSSDTLVIPEIYQQGAVFGLIAWDTITGCQYSLFEVTYNDSCSVTSFCDSTFATTYAIPDGFFCDGDSLSFLMAVMQGAAPYTFTYEYNGIITSDTQTGATESGQFVFADSATLDIYIYDANGCSDHISQTTYCSFEPDPCLDFQTTHAIPDGYFCNGDTIGFLLAVIQGAQPYTFSFTYDAVTTSSIQTSDTYFGEFIFVDGATLEYTITDSLGCSAYHSQTMVCSFAPNPCDTSYIKSLVVSDTMNICTGDSTTIAWQYLNQLWQISYLELNWSYNGLSGMDSGFNESGMIPIVLQDGAIFYFTVTDTIHGCSWTSSVKTLSDPNCDSTMVGLRINPKESAIVMYPNPAYTQLNVQINDAFLGSTLVLSNHLGQVVKNIVLNASNTMVDVSDLSQGIYFATVKTSEGILSTQKLVIQK